MRVGVSTACFYPREPEYALRRLGEMGVRDVEIFFNAHCETQEPILTDVERICTEYGISVRSIHPYFTFAESTLLFSPYWRRFEDGCKIYMELCETCRRLSCDTLVLHGEKEPFKLDDEEYIRRFGILAEKTRSVGVTLTQENIVHFRAHSPLLLRKMADSLGDLFQMTLDIKQAVRSGVDPILLAKEFGAMIRHVHLSDNGTAGDCLPVGKGSFDFEELFRILLKSGFSGVPVVELYRTSYDDEQDLADAWKNAQKILKKALQNLIQDVTIKQEYE